MRTLSLNLREYPSWSTLEIKSCAQIPWNMEAGPDKDHNKSGGKDTGPSRDLSHVGMDSP